MSMTDDDEFAEAGDEDRFFWSDSDVTITPDDEGDDDTPDQT